MRCASLFGASFHATASRRCVDDPPVGSENERAWRNLKLAPNFNKKSSLKNFADESSLVQNFKQIQQKLH